MSLFVIEIKHATQMAALEKKGEKYAGVGKARKQYSVSEADLFDWDTGDRIDSVWYKIDKNTRSWQIWNGIKELKLFHQLKLAEEAEEVKKATERFKALYLMKKRRRQRKK